MKNDENGSDIDQNSQNQWQIKKLLFLDFFRQYGKMSKKVKKDENGSDIDENSQNQWQIKFNYFWIFHKNMEKM